MGFHVKGLGFRVGFIEGLGTMRCAKILLLRVPMSLPYCGGMGVHRE